MNNAKPKSTQDPAAKPLMETRAAFDRVADRYDGELGNNDLIQRLRAHFLSVVKQTFSTGNHLLDMGCGTGLDAVRLAKQGFYITAVDWSEAMVERARSRSKIQDVEEQIYCHHMGAHQMDQFPDQYLDGIYSNLGAVNCIMDLKSFAKQCERTLVDNGRLVISVINRVCPWEIGHYLLRGDWKRALIRLKRDPVAVNLEGEKVWTRYYSPREFTRYFSYAFEVKEVRTMNVMVPPPYRIEWAQKHPRLLTLFEQIDQKIGSWPLIRSLGDHFLVVMEKRT